MVRITLELLRRRSEHNEGMVSTLEEVTLHQFEIEKIENLDVHCRHLRILYLQNNIIARMEGLNRLKVLDYLNLALNNISRIEGIDRCESLRKLDLTLNFVDLEDLEASMLHLRKVDPIRLLYLTGNPCSDWTAGYRKFTIAMVPQLEELDGTAITATERLQAVQELDAIAVELRRLAEENVRKKERMTEEEKTAMYSKEYRVEMAREMERSREDTEKKRLGDAEAKPKETTPVLNHKGEIRQCNEGKYEFNLVEKHEKGKQFVILELFVPRFLDTSMLDVDLNPDYIRVVIKKKVFQMKLMCEIRVEESRVLRSTTTGALQLIMPKVKNSILPIYNLREEPKPIAPTALPQPEPSTEPQRLKEPDWVDDPDVPPLE